MFLVFVLDSVYDNWKFVAMLESVGEIASITGRDCETYKIVGMENNSHKSTGVYVDVIHS